MNGLLAAPDARASRRSIAAGLIVAFAVVIAGCASNQASRSAGSRASASISVTQVSDANKSALRQTLRHAGTSTASILNDRLLARHIKPLTQQQSRGLCLRAHEMTGEKIAYLVLGTGGDSYPRLTAQVILREAQALHFCR